MKTGEWRSFANTHLLPAMGGGKVVRNLAVLPGDDWLLRAVALDTSGFSTTRFSLWAFVLPLYVPTEQIHFTFGSRIGRLGGRNEIWWDAAQPGWEEDASEQTAEEARPFFNAMTSPAALADYIEEHWTDLPNTDPRIIESMAYSRALAGDLARARWALKAAHNAAGQVTAPWAKEVNSRVEVVEVAMSKDEREVERLLRSWRDSNVRELRLAA